jgi:cation transport regulator ChaB
MYRQIQELPQDVREYLPESVQQSFMNAFNGLVERGCDRGSAFQLAWESLNLKSGRNA